MSLKINLNNSINTIHQLIELSKIKSTEKLVRLWLEPTAPKIRVLHANH